jgi:hypothetical protein
MSQYRYTVFGLIFLSEVPLPELILGEGEADVVVRFGDVPSLLPQGQIIDAYYQVSRQRFLLTVEKVGRFLVRNGNEIIIQPAPGSIESDVRLFLLGSCLGALLHQRGLLALHASAIQTKGGAVLFTGHSGSGKSTLLAAFLQRGYTMLADDITSVVANVNQAPMVYPALPRAKLWADAAKQLGHEPMELMPLRPMAQKFSLPTKNHFARRPVSLKRIFLLHPSNKEKPLLERLGKLARFQIILEHTYQEQFLSGLETRDVHLDLAATVAERASMYQVHRPTSSFRLEELADLIEDNF